MTTVGIIRKHWPFIAATAVLYATVAILLLLCMRQNEGHFIYALDDAYIHMATAKNFVLNGVWGVTPYHFSSSVSSLLWPALLSLAYRLFGVSELSPFIINLILATLLIWLTCTLLRRQGLSPLLTFTIGIAMIFFMPVPAMIFAGMEHILQALVTIGFVYLSAQILTHEKATRSKFVWWLILGAMVTATRYEGLLLILVVLALFIARKQYRNSLLLAIISVAPLVIYGVISLTNGWYFLPNSVLLKGVSPVLSLDAIPDLFANFIPRLLRIYYMLIALLTALTLFILQYRKQKTLWKDSSIMLVIFIATTILYFLLSGITWFYRHEAYLVALGIFALTVAAVDHWPRGLPIRLRRSLALNYVAIALLIATTGLLVADRAVPSLAKTPQATTNIYQQQYQMGLFLWGFYQGKAVAANDIGAINYLAEIRCLDLRGIGSRELAKARLNGNYTTMKIYQLSSRKRVKVAIVYDDWFKGKKKIPAQWILVRKWTIPNNVVCGDDTVSFYAVRPEARRRLVRNLRSFSAQLPSGVQESKIYKLE